MQRDRFFTLSASCPDQVGIIARVSGFIAGNGGWILESSFHADALTARYFMRIEIKADTLPFLLADQRQRRQAPCRRPGFQTGALPLRPAGALAGQGTRYRDSLRRFEP